MRSTARAAGSARSPDGAQLPKSTVHRILRRLVERGYARAEGDGVYVLGPRVVYDPNFRARLTSPAAARDALRRVAPNAALVTPSCPDDTVELLGTDDPATAAAAVRELGRPRWR